MKVANELVVATGDLASSRSFIVHTTYAETVTLELQAQQLSQEAH